MTVRVLVVDDDPDICELLGSELRERSYATSAYTSPEDALAALEAEPFDVVITDMRMPRIDGVEVCRRIRQNRPGIPVIVLTAFGEMEVTLGALRAGATDFIPKPHRPEDLEESIARALRRREPEAAARPLPAASGARAEQLAEVVGSSAAMRDLRRRIRQVARSDATVLIVGESGTGKELVARALHDLGPSPGGAFVAVDCAAIPAGLVESELFGHVRGAFTGASDDREGLFVAAHGGTLFLDEVDSLPLAVQAKLLRVLQERAVRPVGSSKEAPFDARLVAAMQSEPRSRVADGTLREDLVYRLDVVRIEPPPLREREDDVIELAERFLEQAAEASGKRFEGLSREVVERLRAHRWPGNVRELHNCIESAVALARGSSIEVNDLPEAVRDAQPTERGDQPLPTLQELEQQHIERVLCSVEGNKAAAAKILGISRATLYRRLAETGDG